MAKNSKRKKKHTGRPPETPEQKAQKKLERAKANPRVAARQEMFRHFRGAGAIGYEMTCAGRLMIVGCFDGLEVEAEAVLAALLDYCDAYWGNYGGGPQVAQHGKIKVDGCAPEVSGRLGEDGILIDRAGEWFMVRDRLLTNAGKQARDAVHNITVDCHWFPDTDYDWAERIINYRLIAKRAELIRKGVDVSLFRIDGQCNPSESDYAQLELARHGAMALVGEKKRMAA